MEGFYWTEVDSAGLASFVFNMNISWDEEAIDDVIEGNSVKVDVAMKGFLSDDPVYEFCRFIATFPENNSRGDDNKDWRKYLCRYYKTLDAVSDPT